MTKVTIDRELLEQVASEFEHDNDRYMLGRELRKVLDAPRQPEGDPHKHEAQPEVAQNTGSRSMTNKLSSQGRTGCTGVEGVAAPCETPDAVDIFAWATFDGEGSHDLRLYEDNENYRDDFRAANPALHPDWVFPLCRLSDAQRAIAELRDRLDVMTQCADNYSRMFEESAEECDILRIVAGSVCGERDTLAAELNGLREDAERYRYLRNTAKWPEAVDYAVEAGSPGQMDAAIDAALAEVNI